jgi:hypothetical protein
MQRGRLLVQRVQDSMQDQYYIVYMHFCRSFNR